MKWWIAGIIAGFVFVYWCVPVLYSGMKKHDYQTLYHGIQNGKRAAGSFVSDGPKKFVSYGEKYARGLE